MDSIYNIWSPAVHHTISLSPLAGTEIDEILDLWNNRTYLNLKKINVTTPLGQYLIDNQNPTPIRSILSSVRKHFNACALIEEPYLDLEYWDSHAGYYARSFSQYRLDCIRLHFFQLLDGNEEEQLKRLIELLNKGACKNDIDRETALSWIGYCVLRPTHSYNVGRAGIKFNSNPVNEWPESVSPIKQEKGSKPYIKAVQECSANLLNAKFVIDTTEFIQQDPNLGHCGTASLWVASNLMAKKFGTHKFHYRTITQQALGQWNRETEAKQTQTSSAPENGLTPSEIINAISAMGATTFDLSPLETETIQESQARLTHEIYSFMESGFPVLLCITKKNDSSKHVVSVVGHSLPPVKKINRYVNASSILDKNQRNSFTDRHYLIGNMIKVFYVHDDSYGPFNRIIVPTYKRCLDRPKKQQNGENDYSFNVKLGRETEYLVDQAIIPVEPMIKVSATPIFRDLIEWFNDHYAEQYHDKEVFLWRPVLLTGSEFKQSICKRKYSEIIKEKYSTLHLPKFIWLFEFSAIKPDSISEYFYSEDYKYRLIDGEFIYDATIPQTKVRRLAERIFHNYIDYRGEYTTASEEIKYPCYELACEKGDCNECKTEN